MHTPLQLPRPACISRAQSRDESLFPAYALSLEVSESCVSACLHKSIIDLYICIYITLHYIISCIINHDLIIIYLNFMICATTHTCTLTYTIFKYARTHSSQIYIHTRTHHTRTSYLHGIFGANVGVGSGYVLSSLWKTR